MERKNQAIGALVLAGVAGSTAGVAFAQEVVGAPNGVINVSGATLLSNFVSSQASSRDFIDVDGDFLRRGAARISLIWQGLSVYCGSFHKPRCCLYGFSFVLRLANTKPRGDSYAIL